MSVLLPVSQLPKEMRLSKRWTVEVGGEVFRGLHLEQAILLALHAMSPRSIGFELGMEEPLGYWFLLFLPLKKSSAKAIEIKTGLVQKGGFSFTFVHPQEGKTWGYLFLGVRPPRAPEFSLVEGIVQIGDKVIGKEIPRLSEEKIAHLEEMASTL